ncbi:NIL domain-containing protein [Leptolyngbya sp. AN02str]|uniref:NIL domain-containing protein n=1 Tax=Leptolyngbya sp. AN02str TaxID=3423363 RepID=UPI003D32131B
MSILLANLIQIRVRVFVPKRFRGEPVLSYLTSRYGITFNIITATLKSESDGQFDLELTGTTEQIRRGLDYMKAMDLSIISRPNPDGGGWHQ